MPKFMSYQDRLAIEKGLTEQKSFGKIGQEIGKDRTTVAKEIKKFSYEKKSGYSAYPYNACKKRSICKLKMICEKQSCTHQSVYKCSLCSSCNDLCAEFEEDVCTVIQNPPYVCNGCSSLGKCTLKKNLYDAADAHTRFSAAVSESRSGILSNEIELARLNALITPLIRNGQSLHQIYCAHADEMTCSEKTLYNYIDATLFDVRNIDLPRKVKYRPRYKKPEFKVDRGCRLSRSYEDFKNFMEKHSDTPVVEMDSVIGSKGGKVLLTIHFVDTSLMLAFLRDANTSQSVTHLLDALFGILGRECFQKLFPVILTDNGSEFSNPKAIEYGPEQKDILRTRIFYCDPSSPYQKGSIEVNHELIRRILPKGRSFDDLTQKDIFLMMNHVNSYKRKKLNGRSPYEAFSFYYGEDTAQKLGCSSVAPENIILKPRLLKR